MTAPEPGNGADRRDFFRMDVALPFRHQRVGPDEIDAVRLQIETNVTDEPLETDSETTMFLARIEAKLDLLVAVLDPERPRPVSDQDLRGIEISGSGALFVWSEPESQDDNLLIDLALPGTIPRHVRVVARVVSCTPSPDTPGHYRIAVAFEVIDELDRDAIVRYLLQLQRKARRPAPGGVTPGAAE